nr:hypothetical protein SHINE37_43388 [Rhizobiaceae bacterium]
MPFSPASTSPLSVLTVANGSAAKAVPARAATANGTRTRNFMVVSHRYGDFPEPPLPRHRCLPDYSRRLEKTDREPDSASLSFPYVAFPPSQSKPDPVRS